MVARGCLRDEKIICTATGTHTRWPAPSRAIFRGMNTHAGPRVGIPLRPDRTALAADAKRSFIRAATATALSQIQKTNAERILNEAWPNDARAALIVRSPVTPMKSGDYPGGVLTGLMQLAPKSAAVRLFELAVQVNLKGLSQFSFPLASSFTAAQFFEEGQPISVGIGDFVGMQLGPTKKNCVARGVVERA
jgi:hypothetical protein